MVNIQIEMLPTEDRDRALGKYMDAFSRLELIVDQLIASLMGASWPVARAVSSVLYSKQRSDLLKLLASVRLPSEFAERIARACERVSRRNMRRNHIIHGTWAQYCTVSDTGYEAEWVRCYAPVDPNLAAIQDLLDPKLIGIYNFTIPELDRATGHVEEMLTVLSPLIGEIRELLPPQPPPEESPGSETAAQ